MPTVITIKGCPKCGASKTKLTVKYCHAVGGEPEKLRVDCPCGYSYFVPCLDAAK